MCSENYYATFFVTNLGIVADRPRIKMLAARPQYADHVVTLVPDVFLTEAWTVVPDMAGDQTCQGTCELLRWQVPGGQTPELVLVV